MNCLQPKVAIKVLKNLVQWGYFWKIENLDGPTNRVLIGQLTLLL
jgi:hypothetical protein